MTRESDNLPFYSITINTPSGTEDEQDAKLDVFLEQMCASQLATHETFINSDDEIDVTIEAMGASESLRNFISTIFANSTSPAGDRFVIGIEKYGGLTEHALGSGIANFLEEEKCADEIIPICEIYHFAYYN